jgi:type I restriction enzyme S subunit
MKIFKLGEVVDLINGSTPLKSNKNYWSNGDVPWFTVDDLRSQGKYITYTEKFITQLGLKESSISLVPENAVLLCCTASVGAIAINKIRLTTNQQFNALVVRDTNQLSVEYLYYWFLANMDRLKSLGRATTIDYVSMSKLRDMDIQLPSLDKQRDVVEKLDSTFAEIDFLEKNLSVQKSALSEISSGKLDQTFSLKNELHNEIRQITLSEIARVINGRAYSQPELLKEGLYPVLRVGNFFSNRSWYYSDLELDKDKYCDNGDLLYAWSASFGPRIWDGSKVIYHYHIWKIEENKELVLRDWLYWWFLWDVKQIKQAHGTGSTMMHVTKGAMESRLVQLPSLEVQSQQIQEISELQLATQKLESNYKTLAENWSSLRNAVLASVFAEEVA